MSFFFVCTFFERVLGCSITFSVRKRRKCHASAYFLVYAAQFLSCSLWQKRPSPSTIPVGSTFNIQNFIPHKFQKTKAVPEANKAKEFQRGTVGATGSAKEGTKVLAEGSDIGLGCEDRSFELHRLGQQERETSGAKCSNSCRAEIRLWKRC